MRYFVRCTYNGTRYHGWQAQSGDTKTIQGEIEHILSTVLRSPTPICGCGRTDAGVHAADYVFHVDLEADPNHVLYKLNRMTSDDISFRSIRAVGADAHARFDAVSRSYRYHIIDYKDPFRRETAFSYPAISSIDRNDLQACAELLLEYKDFTTFCKEGGDVIKKECTLTESRWEFRDGEYIYHVTANRFLRGMIRLIVGMCINVAQCKLTLEEVREALIHKRRLSKDLSVTGKGLFLDTIVYPSGIYLE